MHLLLYNSLFLSPSFCGPPKRLPINNSSVYKPLHFRIDQPIIYQLYMYSYGGGSYTEKKKIEINAQMGVRFEGLEKIIINSSILQQIELFLPLRHKTRPPPPPPRSSGKPSRMIEGCRCSLEHNTIGVNTL